MLAMELYSVPLLRPTFFNILQPELRELIYTSLIPCANVHITFTNHDEIDGGWGGEVWGVGEG